MILGLQVKILILGRFVHILQWHYIDMSHAMVAFGAESYYSEWLGDGQKVCVMGITHADSSSWVSFATQVGIKAIHKPLY